MHLKITEVKYNKLMKVICIYLYINTKCKIRGASTKIGCVLAYDARKLCAY